MGPPLLTGRCPSQFGSDSVCAAGGGAEAAGGATVAAGGAAEAADTDVTDDELTRRVQQLTLIVDWPIVLPIQTLSILYLTP